MYRLALIAVTTVFPALSAMATDPYPIDPVSEMTSRWADAARGVNSLHADIRQFEYDHVYRTVSESVGTLDFERPNRCRLELRPVSANPAKIGGFDYQPHPRSALTTVWTGDELILINPDIRPCEVVRLNPASRNSEERTDRAIDSVDSTLDDTRVDEIRKVYEGDWFWETLVSSLRPSPRRTAVNQSSHQPSWLPLWSLYASPEEALPMLLSDPDSVTRQGFRLEQRTDSSRGISAIPFTREGRAWHGVKRIDILFDEETGLPYATRAISEHRTVVRVLKNVRINLAIDDHDPFDPNLESLGQNWQISR